MLLLVVVPLDDVVALRDAGLAASLITQEVGPPEQLLLVERELPHPSGTSTTLLGRKKRSGGRRRRSKPRNSG